METSNIVETTETTETTEKQLIIDWLISVQDETVEFDYM
jgi:hypothetical protein